MQLVQIGIATLLLCTVQVQCGDSIPERTCATLYSKSNSAGSTFTLKDFDQSVNMKRDYRSSLKGWHFTGSIKVEPDCKLDLCSDPYHLGNCISYTAENYTIAKEQHIKGAQTAECTCERKCSCSDIIIPRDDKVDGFVGRAYFKKGCSICDNGYVRFKKNATFPWPKKKVFEAFVIARGCNVTLFSEATYFDYKDETVITKPVLQGFKKTVESSKAVCKNVSITRPSPPSNKTYPEKIDIPETKKEILKMRSSKPTLATHPGYQAALRSAENARSPKNAYVIFIGDGSLYENGFHHCKTASTEQIGECRIAVKLAILGISTQLRVLTIPIGNNALDDYTLMASLDEYLAKQKDLKDAYPNAVIVHIPIGDTHLEKQGSVSRRTLQTVHALRARVLDRKRSNLVFILSDLDKVSKDTDKSRPEGRIAYFEEKITKNWAFTKPLRFCINSEVKKISTFINGYLKMENNEYFPKNLEMALGDICKKAGDPLGELILKAIFEDNYTPHYSLAPTVQPNSINAMNINRYNKLASSPPPKEDLLEAQKEVEDMGGQNTEYPILFGKGPAGTSGGSGRPTPTGSSEDAESSGDHASSGDHGSSEDTESSGTLESSGTPESSGTTESSAATESPGKSTKSENATSSETSDSSETSEPSKTSKKPETSAPSNSSQSGRTLGKPATLANPADSENSTTKPSSECCSNLKEEIKDYLEDLHSNDTKRIEELKGLYVGYKTGIDEFKGFQGEYKQGIEELKELYAGYKREIEELKNVHTVFKKEAEELKALHVGYMQEIKELKDLHTTVKQETEQLKALHTGYKEEIEQLKDAQAGYKLEIHEFKNAFALEKKERLEDAQRSEKETWERLKLRWANAFKNEFVNSTLPETVTQKSLSKTKSAS